MKTLSMSSAVLAAVAVVVVPMTASAQTISANSSSDLRAERLAQAVQAARNFKPGEGDPVPHARPQNSREERVQTYEDRRREAIAAARSFRSAEGSPKPAAARALPRDLRRSQSAAMRATVAAANKAGQLPSFGENYGSQQ